MMQPDPRDLDDLPAVLVYGDVALCKIVPGQLVMLDSLDPLGIQMIPPAEPPWWEAIE